jgi:hypothetical protein
MVKADSLAQQIGKRGLRQFLEIVGLLGDRTRRTTHSDLKATSGYTLVARRAGI